MAPLATQTIHISGAPRPPRPLRCTVAGMATTTAEPALARAATIRNPPTEAELPRRPCLPPGIHAYQRAIDELQIGIEARRAVLLTDLAPRLVAVLRSLDGRTPLGRLRTRAGPEHDAELRYLLGELANRGLLVDAAGPHRMPWAIATVAIRGDGPLAAGIAQQLAIAGVGQIVVQAAGEVTVADVAGVLNPHEVGQPRRAAVERVIQATGSSSATGPPPSDRSPDLVVLTDALVPAPEVVRQLMCERQEHLLVATRDGAGIVGPLVLPARSSCLRCADLHRTDRDRCWPRVANQLAGRVQHADPPTTQATAALAVTQVLRALQPGNEPPQLLDTTIELDLAEGRTLTRHWEPHPFCECGASARWEVEAA